MAVALVGICNFVYNSSEGNMCFFLIAAFVAGFGRVLETSALASLSGGCADTARFCRPRRDIGGRA